MDSVTERLSEDGFAVMPSLIPPAGALQIAAELAELFAGASAARGIRRSRGQVYAARNLGRLWTGTRKLAELVQRRTPLKAIVGESPRLVRAIFFDKPPGRSWSLPWHRDKMLPIRSPHGMTSPTKVFQRGGVPHIKGDLGVLSEMLTLRLHLDAATERNGALLVVPGSHQSIEMWHTAATGPPDNIRLVAAARGDAVLMRPLLLHKSNARMEGEEQHRRVVHLEFAPAQPPADGLTWADPF